MANCLIFKCIRSVMSVYDCDFTAFLYPAFVVIVIYTRTLYGRCPPTSQIYVFLKEELCIQILFLCKKKFGSPPLSDAFS